jgi:gliding motility-associated-like protein
VRYFLLIIAVILPAIAEAQLSAPGMSAVRYTSYPSAPGVKDPVFIFCNASGTQKGSLNAVSPGGVAPFNFSWFRWDDLLSAFVLIPGLSTSSLSDLDEGGYRVRITDSDTYDTTLTGWIFLNKPYASAQLQNRTCDYVALRGRAATDTFYYKDPTSGNRVILPDAVKFLWSSDPSSSIPYPDLEMNPQTFSPPLVDVTYMIQVTDSFNCVSESSFFYESIHVKAEFTVEPDKGEAPLSVTFTDKSIRGSRYLWEFGDTTTSKLSNPEPHIYYKPGRYFPKLTIESVLHCIDSVKLELPIVVDDSELNIPNVFTPNGDSFNDNFIVESKSLKYISVEIFSRSGMRVYNFYGEGERLRNWTGWDGNVNNSSIKASPGVYFYIIRAYGWDDIDYNSKDHRGVVYLYR